MMAKPSLLKASSLILLVAMSLSFSPAEAATEVACAELYAGDLSLTEPIDEIYEAEWDIEYGLEEEPATATVIGLIVDSEPLEVRQADEIVEEVKSIVGGSSPSLDILTTAVKYAEGSTPSIDVIMDVREVRNSRDSWKTWARATLFDNQCNVMFQSETLTKTIKDGYDTDETQLYTFSLELVDESINIADAVELYLAVGASHCNKSWGWGGDYGCDADLSKSDSLSVTVV